MSFGKNVTSYDSRILSFELKREICTAAYQIDQQKLVTNEYVRIKRSLRSQYNHYFATLIILTPMKKCF